MSAKQFNRLECIGSGSFGKVWLVRFSGNGRKYVLKEVRVRGLTDKEIDQAVTEVKVLSSLGHFNVIRYKQAFVEEEALNIIMEYANGGDLYSKIEGQVTTGEYFEECQVLNWFTQISFALKYIHRENILHRDLKPQNIFLTTENVIKVGDFGIAKVLLTESGKAETAIGTPYYISPEMCQSQPYNKKSDIWALGCLLYEMATLKHAFEGPSFNNLMVKIIHGDYGKLPSHYPFNPTSSLIEMMLQHDPEDRPTVDQVLRLPSLRCHIRDYEVMALKIIDVRREKRASFTSLGYRERKHSLSELSTGSPQSLTPGRQQRSQSLDSGKKSKNNLRKAVILRQALSRSSSVNSSTYVLSPSLSPVKALPLQSISDDVPQTSCTAIDDLEDDVFVSREDSSSDPSPAEVCCQALCSAKRGNVSDAMEYINQAITRDLGAESSSELMFTISNYLDENIADNSLSLKDLKEFLPPGLATDVLLMAMLYWYMDKG